MLKDEIIEIFVEVDDFCKEFDVEIKNHRLNTVDHKLRNRKSALSDSEIITILIAFHSGSFYQSETLLLAHLPLLQRLLSRFSHVQSFCGITAKSSSANDAVS